MEIMLRKVKFFFSQVEINFVSGPQRKQVFFVQFIYQFLVPSLFNRNTFRH